MEIREILIKEIRIRENIRAYEMELNELMRSIKDNGLLQPIGVKEEEKGYTIIWGHRRFNACKKLGWKSIPAVIFLTKEDDLSEEEFFVINATENIQRKDVNLKEFGRVCKILKKNMSNSEIASRLSVPTHRVVNALNEISRVPIKWQGKVRTMNGEPEKKGDIPLSTASKVMSFKGLTGKQKDDLLEDVSKNETGYLEISYLAGFLRKGLTIAEAKKQLDKYKLVTFKVLLEKKQFNEFLDKYNNVQADFLIDTLNARAGDSNFAVKVGQNYDSSIKNNKGKIENDE